ncbi:MAG: YopX family protein [Streptococcus mitis]|nr:YopX family protein [Streptococcus mitis]
MLRFRGLSVDEYNEEEGKWKYGYLIEDKGDSFIINQVIEANEQYITIGSWCPVNPATLGQSTVLFDKNGMEIFDGDIVKMAKDVYSEQTYYEVVRHCSGAYRLESKQHGCELWLRHTDCEIVGNVYENRDLLEDKE